MKKTEKLIEKAYAAFADFAKPEQCTRQTDAEGAEFNLMLHSVTRRDLTMDQIGTVAWGALPSLSAEALAYFMPRLIELAVTNATDRDGQPFFCHFVCAFDRSANDERLRQFGPSHRIIMVETFDLLCLSYHGQLKNEGWFEEAQQAAGEWAKSDVVR